MCKTSTCVHPASTSAPFPAPLQSLSVQASDVWEWVEFPSVCTLRLYWISSRHHIISHCTVALVCTVCIFNLQICCLLENVFYAMASFVMAGQNSASCPFTCIPIGKIWLQVGVSGAGAQQQTAARPPQSAMKTCRHRLGFPPPSLPCCTYLSWQPPSPSTPVSTPYTPWPT